MKRTSLLVACMFVSLSVLHIPLARGASISSDGGITLTLAYGGGDLNREGEYIAGSNPIKGENGYCHDTEEVEYDSIKDYFEFMWVEVAKTVWQMTEEAHYIKRIIVIDEDSANYESALSAADVLFAEGTTVNQKSAPGGWKVPHEKITFEPWTTSISFSYLPHEIAHYVYTLGDEYDGSFRGFLPVPGLDDEIFMVQVLDKDYSGCPHTIMNGKGAVPVGEPCVLPPMFCDYGDHKLHVKYEHPDIGYDQEFHLRPETLDDTNREDDGPNRYQHWQNFEFRRPFAEDNWQSVAYHHVDLMHVHELDQDGNGIRPEIDWEARPKLEFVYQDTEESPGRVILIDRSGSMNYSIYGRPAVDYVQETALVLYHGAPSGERVGAYAYNESIEALYEYDEYEDEDILVDFYNATGMTDIHLALKTAVDAILNDTVEPAGATIFLMSDGKPTVNADALWEEVERARENSIKINTLHYGDADQVLMDRISLETSGNAVPVAISDDAHAAKLASIAQMAREEGMNEIHNTFGELTQTGTTDTGYVYQVNHFTVPQNSTEFRFLLVPRNTESTKYFYLILDPAGTPYYSSQSEVQKKGMFLGTNIDEPIAGEYTTMIISAQPTGTPPFPLPEGEVQLLAFAQTPELIATTWLPEKRIDAVNKDSFVLYATVQNDYPLANVTTTAYFSSLDGTPLTSVEMNDDGYAGDSIAGDGVYSTTIDTSDIGSLEQCHILVRHDVTLESVPAEFMNISDHRGYDAILADYTPEAFTLFSETWGQIAYEEEALINPVVDLSQFGDTVRDGGQVYTETFEVVHAVTDEDSLRINLGPNAEVVDVQTEQHDNGTTVQITFETDIVVPNNKVNIEVNVQVGDTILETIKTEIEQEECVYGVESVRVSNFADVESSLYSKQSIEINANGFVSGDLYSGGSVFLGSNAVVEGDVYVSGAYTPQAGAHVDGTIHYNAVVELDDLETKTISYGTETVVASWDTGCHQVLQPGSYRSLIVRPGCMMTLTAGEYFVYELTVDADGDLNIDGTVIVNAEQQFNIGDRATVLGVANPRDFSVYTNQQWQVRVGPQGDFTGYITAPKTEVAVFSNAFMEGCIHSKRVNLEAYSIFVGDSVN